MARNSDHLAGAFETEDAGGLLTGFLAEEEDFDRRALWRLGSWGAAAVGAVIIALLANRSSIGSRRDEVAAADLIRQSQQIQLVARDSQTETRRLASAVDTLNGDRDRLYSRVTVLEQGLESVTGAIARQSTAAPPASSAPTAKVEPPSAPQAAASAPSVAPVTTTAATPPTKSPAGPAAAEARTEAASPSVVATSPSPPTTPLMASKSIMAPPDPPAGKLIAADPPPSAVSSAPMKDVVASIPLGEDADAVRATPPQPVQRTEFGIDVGAANSLGGLRTLWRGLLKSNRALAALRPIVVVKESGNGSGLQLRLVAGPLGDAATAAKICAVLIESERSCETSVFDGQRLAMTADEPPASARPAPRKRGTPKRAAREEPSAKKPDSTTISSLFGKRTADQ